MRDTMLTRVPCALIRGGTSRGVFFLRADLPADRETLSKVLLAVMGSPDTRQIDGLGGATSLTSKVAMVSPAAKGPEQVDYLFAQVAVDRPSVDYGPTCGNTLAGVGPFAIEAGLVRAENDETKVLIRAVNTGALIEAIVQTPGGYVEYEGDARIDGVPGTAAPVALNFMDIVGSRTGATLPTGKARDVIEGIEVTCMDVAMPVVIARARDLGKTGHEAKEALATDAAFMARIERIRRAAGEHMGMGNVAGRVTPKFAIIAPPRNGGSIASRYFTPDSCHAAYAVTGAICVATCAVMRGSVAEGLSRVERLPAETVSLEHPSGFIEVMLRVRGHDEDMSVESAGILRTARRLMSGDACIPSNLWRPQDPAV